MHRLLLYMLRWQLSTPLLWIVINNIENAIYAALIANLLGALMFYKIDKFIIRKK